jgi:phage-related protein (TIGR01555 family)
VYLAIHESRSRKVPRRSRLVRSIEDGWENVYTGPRPSLAGTSAGALGSALTSMTQEVAQEMWQGDDVLARAVETPAERDALREGFSVKVEGDRDLLRGAGERPPHALVPRRSCMEAMNYARAFGGAGIIAGPMDGSVDLEKPLKERADLVKSRSSPCRSPRELIPETWYGDPTKVGRYGLVSKYRLCPLDTPPEAVSTMPLIHESRIIRVDGVRTSRSARFRNSAHPGWDDSIFVRLAQIAADFQHAWQGAAILLQDFATPTLKIKHLAQVLGGKNGSAKMADRAAAVEMCRSIARVVIVDADGEDYKRETVTVTGLAEMLDKLAVRYAAALGWPVAFVMGQAPAGLNATGASDIRFFYDQMKSVQRRTVTPILRALTRWLMFADGKNPDEIKWKPAFPPLWQMTDLEKADLRLKQAQVDKLEIDSNMITPEEAAKSRHGADGYSTETVIDLDLRDKMQEDEQHQTGRLGVPNEQDQREREAQVAAAEANAKNAGKEPPPFAKKDERTTKGES